MKLLKLVMEGLPNFKDQLEIDFIANQRVNDNDKEHLCNLFSNVFVNKVIAFVGINASGKTKILKAITFALKLLNNESINNIQTKEILSDLKINNTCIITAYFYHEGFVHKLQTHIIKKVNSLEKSEKFLISDEKLWSKESKKVKAKKHLFDFKKSDLKVKRNQDEQYLMEDVSIMIALNKKNNMDFFVRDMLVWTDHNMLSVLAEFPKELLTFLDPSIEYLECIEKDKEFDIKLKFYGKEEIVINNPISVEKYLSSGTVKGLSVFMNALISFFEGGYLIIDEIENHFNREIVATLLRFFMDKRVNKNGATILFSTHYSDLLDEFDRNDCIYIVRNREGINAENLSRVLKRNDIKKSEVYDSDYLVGTVPSYEAYLALKKVLISFE